MAFKIHSTDDGRVPGIEYLPCGAIAPKVGMALVQADGNLAVATGESMPTYISMCERETACIAGDLIPVVRVLPDVIYEATFSEAADGVVLGDKLTIHTDGLQVTSSAGGAAEVVSIDGTAAGDAVRVRFV